MENDTLDGKHYLFIGIIIVLSGLLLFFSYAAQKDMKSLEKAYTECIYKYSLAESGSRILLYNGTNKIIQGELNVTTITN